MGDDKMPIGKDGFITIPRDLTNWKSLLKYTTAIQKSCLVEWRSYIGRKKKDVNDFNFIIHSQINGELITYKSVDTVKNQT